MYHGSAWQMSNEKIEENNTVPVKVNKLNNSEYIRKSWRNALKLRRKYRNEDGCLLGCCTVYSGRY
jgi:hypothetical protein